MSLEQPNFETGIKNIFTAGFRRGIKSLRLHHLREIANFSMSPFLRPDIRQLKDRLKERLSTDDPGDKLLAENFLFLPHEVVLRASKFHFDSWLRDEFVGCLALNDPEVEYELLHNFVKHRDENFHVPTTRLFGGKLLGERKWYFDDESTALALIWRAKIAMMGKPLLNEEITDHDKIFWQYVLNEVRSHTKDGLFYTGAGIEKTWFDAFNFRERDIVTYNQGIYTTALIAAKTLGLEVSDSEIQQAAVGYNNLVHPSGRLQLSQKVPYYDVSSLFGEFLAQWLFNKRLLEKETVAKTYQSFIPLDTNSFKVVAKENGGFLDPSEFNEPYQPMIYQNGREWVLFTVAARYVFERNSLFHHREFWKDKLRTLIATKNAESVVPGERYTFDHSRVGHLWNSAVYAMAKKVMTAEDYQDAITNKLFRATIISEASQLPNSSL